MITEEQVMAGAQTTIGDVMSSDLGVVQPDATVLECANRMAELDVGVLPVVEEGEVLGIVTDRDIVLRAIARQRPGDVEERADPTITLTAQDVMTSPVTFCYEDEDADDVARMLQQKQIRRVLVRKRSNDELVGIASLGDLAVKAGPAVRDRAGEVLAGVSQPLRGKVA